MINAIIIDDDPDFVELLENFIKKANLPMHVIDVALNATDGYTSIRNNKPDVVFLDVEMPGKNGIDLAGDFPERDFEIVFTTSHDRYAVQAFKIEALDYLIKPIDIIALSKVVDRIMKVKNEKIFHVPVQSGMEINKLTIVSKQGIFFVEISKIIRCEADNVYTTIYLLDKKTVVSTKSLKDHESYLKPFGFIRVHKSHLVNVNSIIKYNRGEPGYLQMSDESVIPVSKSWREELHKRINIS